jgi:hypothetical protein
MHYVHTHAQTHYAMFMHMLACMCTYMCLYAHIYVYTCRNERALAVGGGAVPQEEDTVGEATRERRGRRPSSEHVFEADAVASAKGKTQKKREVVVTKSMCTAWGRDAGILDKYRSRRQQIVAGALPWLPPDTAV